MNLNLPTNLFYLRENFTDETEDETKDEAPPPAAVAEEDDVYGDWGNVIERMVISVCLMLHSFFKIGLAPRPKPGRTLIYVLVSFLGFVVTLSELIYITNYATTGEHSAADPDAATIAEEDGEGWKTSTILYSLRKINYFFLGITILLLMLHVA